MAEENLSEKKKEHQKLIKKIIFYVIAGLALLNIIGMLAPTWLLMGTLLSLALFIYENSSKPKKLEHVAFIIIIFGFLGATIRLNFPLDALLKGVAPLSCEEFHQTGVFTGGCGPEPLSNVWPRINDTIALLVLAAPFGIQIFKRES